MKKENISPLKRRTLIKLGLLLPVFVYFAFDSWMSLLVFLGIWSYCLYKTFYGREEDIKEIPLRHTNPVINLNDGNLGCGSRTHRKWSHGY